MLRFPYDERLRQLLRAIPGRRWDPEQRAWCVPLEPEQAEALARLLAGLPGEPEVSDALARAIERRRARRRRDECLLDLARPDEDWWLSFATDAAPERSWRLLEHPEARLPAAIGRALVPLDERAAEMVERARARGSRLRRATTRAHALPRSARTAGRAGRRAGRRRRRAYDVEFRRDRRGEHWILVAARMRAARARARRAGRAARSRRVPAARSALAARRARRASARASCSRELEDASVDPRVTGWLERATTWRGTIEVDGPARGDPCSCCSATPSACRAAARAARSAPGGATVPLDARLLAADRGELRRLDQPAARRCVAALREGRPAPPAVLELSTLHEDPTFVLAPGPRLRAARGVRAARRRAAPAGRPGAARRRREHARLPAIRADPFCVPELDRFLAAHDVWVEPEALALLQEVREQHARAAGLVALSAATDAPLERRRASAAS